VTCCHPGESLRSPQAHQCPRSFQQDEPRLPVHATTTARMPESRKFATYLVADLRRVHETELAGGVGTQYGEHPKTGVSRSRRGPPARCCWMSCRDLARTSRSPPAASR
jgi:hypothetical protein